MASLDTVPALTGDLLLQMAYDSSGLVWCMLTDVPVIGWQIDPNAKALPAPVTVLPPPPAPPATDPVLSPAWAIRQRFLMWNIPGFGRHSSAAALFTLLATNNGANRKLWADFADGALQVEWQQWCAINPDLTLSEAPA
jgi:hypothetical protein